MRKWLFTIQTPKLHFAGCAFIRCDVHPETGGAEEGTIRILPSVH